MDGTTPVVARWCSATGSLAAARHLRVLLPVALAGGEEQTRALRLDVPSAAATYRLTLTREGARADVRALALVGVTGGASS
jgi:hypothetical protein